MNAPEYDRLELLSHPASGSSAHATPLLFIHGAYAGAWCWQEHFLPWFAARGWNAHALSLSGHGGSRGHAQLDGLSINDYVDDIVETVAALPMQPVLIGHSMGGMVVQKYLERAAAPAAVLMASVPPQGLMSATLGMLFSTPHLLVDLNRLMGGGEVRVDSLREALFHQPIENEQLMRYWQLSQPESHRAIWDMTFFNLPHPAHAHKVPMLILGARHDRLVSPGQVSMTAITYGLDAEIFDGLGHGMMLERDWEQVASRIDAWLTIQNL
ncbi:MAG: alpha/beta fold hydrolase [Azoarcus sp.]|nr:alpha/beta fold hydrolase [Azoarcus sp.]